MMDIEEDQQVWCICFLVKETGSGATSTVGAYVNEVIAQELHKL